MNTKGVKASSMPAQLPQAIHLHQKAEIGTFTRESVVLNRAPIAKQGEIAALCARLSGVQAYRTMVPLLCAALSRVKVLHQHHAPKKTLLFNSLLACVFILFDSSSGAATFTRESQQRRRKWQEKLSRCLIKKAAAGRPRVRCSLQERLGLGAIGLM
jgi:hypothetical protein